MNLDSSDFNSQLSGAGGEDDVLVERGGDGAGLGDAAFDLATKGKSKVRVNDTIVVLIATCTVAGGVILGMRYLTQLSGERMRADDAVAKSIDEFIAQSTQLTRTQVPTGRDLVAGLTDDRTQAQVPVDMLKKNPFYVSADPGTGGHFIPPPPAIDPNEDLIRQREARRNELDRAAAKMKLTSVTGRTDNYLALLDGKVVREGDIVAEKFKIRTVEQYRLVLGAIDDPVYRYEIELRRR